MPLLLNLLLLACPFTGASAQTTPAPQKLSEQLLDKVPADLREQARRHLALPEATQNYWLTLAADTLREEVLAALTASPEAADFVLERLPSEASPLHRARIVRNVPNYEHWRTHPRLRQALSRLIADDPEAAVVREALESLRVLEMRALRAQLERRLEDERRKGRGATLQALGQEQERWISLERGAMLPAFMRAVPPAFSLKKEGERVRVIAFGDFGTGSEEQRKLAAAMLRYHQKRSLDFGITLGDNFYPRGMTGPEDPRWQTQWEGLYGPLKIEVYAVMGNHDWYGADSPAAELLYASRSRSWRMPAPYYTFTAGDAQFFALDTNDISEAQLLWLDAELGKSRSRWKVVYGHFPVYSATRGDNALLVARLLPLMKGRVDVYIAGHDHNLQHLKAEGGVAFFVSGGGGAGLYDLGPYERSLFKSQSNGFAVIEADKTSLAVSFVDAEGRELYRHAVK